ncbi:hypothetical protein [Streptomyces kanamyceticus]|uniref:Uncharacterized protein n=1 Tax=Streptomyces kanamyceticus TaxID=1967 RepID=A0A5J6GJR3_STRKN|nr:hypothetical protein [Streptomyces kanamyceticus]QEU94692.1 hypothetical protein CP970_30765 [Streptomyces kanamyceticus]
MTTETSTETQWNTEPQEAAPARSGLASRLSGAGRHRGPVAEHDEVAAPRGRHRKQDQAS